jgi:hypothetical protein
MNTTRQQVSDLEIAQAPTIATLFRVAQALQVAPACLVLIAENRRRELAHRLSVPQRVALKPAKLTKDCSTSALSFAATSVRPK